MSDIGTKIKELRISHGLSRKKLAQLLGLSYSAIAMYEKGKREPDTEKIYRMVQIFDVDMSELIGTASSVVTDHAPVNNTGAPSFASIPMDSESSDFLNILKRLVEKMNQIPDEAVLKEMRSQTLMTLNTAWHNYETYVKMERRIRNQIEKELRHEFEERYEKEREADLQKAYNEMKERARFELAEEKSRLEAEYEKYETELRDSFHRQVEAEVQRRLGAKDDTN